jgi:hypothetical protein
MRMPTKRKGPPTPETLIKDSIKSFLDRAGFFHWYVLQGVAAQKGISDLMAIDHRPEHRGRLIAIEVKAPNGKVSELQQIFMDFINGAGGNAFVARSIEDVIDGLGLQDRFLIRGR